MPIRALIVDDHSVVRQGLQMFLVLDPDIEVIGEAKTGVRPSSARGSSGPMWPLSRR